MEAAFLNSFDLSTSSFHGAWVFVPGPENFVASQMVKYFRCFLYFLRKSCAKKDRKLQDYKRD